jgi:hypothetical protein
MKKYKILILILFIPMFVFSQSKDVKSKSKTISAYGGPLINFTQVDKNWGLMIGGKGGILINKKFSSGGIGMGMVKNPVYNEDRISDETSTPLEVSLGAGGMFLEYFLNFNIPVSLSIPINIMAGGVSLKDKFKDKEIESSSIFILEPGINMELKVSKHFIPTINVSYRQVYGSSLTYLDNHDISGINIGLILRVGNFN